MQIKRCRRPLAAMMAAATALALSACSGGDSGAEEDPGEAMQAAAAEVGEWEGLEVVMSAEADDDARAFLASQDEAMGEDVLDLLLGAQVTMRGSQPEEGTGDFELMVSAGDEDVLGVRQPVDDDLYVRLDLGAVESLAGDVEGGEEVSSSLSELDAMGGMMGLGDVLEAARNGDWIQVTGVEELAESFSGQAGGDGEAEVDEEEAQALAEELSATFQDFLDDEGVTVEHLGSEDAGDHVRMTASGAALRDLMGEVSQQVDDLESLGMGGMDAPSAEELEAELEEIPEDLELSVDAWLDGDRLSRVGMDVFELARQSPEGSDVEGSMMLLFDLAEFTGGVEAPDAATTFDPAEALGGLFGGMGAMDGLGDAPAGGMSGDGAGDASGGAGGGDELTTGECLPEEQLDMMLEQAPEEQRDMIEQQFEAC